MRSPAFANLQRKELRAKTSTMPLPMPSIQFNSIKLEGLVLVRHLILVHHRRPEGWLVPTDGA